MYQIVRAARAQFISMLEPPVDREPVRARGVPSVPLTLVLQTNQSGRRINFVVRPVQDRSPERFYKRRPAIVTHSHPHPVAVRKRPAAPPTNKKQMTAAIMREEGVGDRSMFVKHSRLSQLEHRPFVQIENPRRIIDVDVDKSDATNAVVRTRGKAKKIG